MVKKINRAKVQNNYELANLLSGLLQQKSQYLIKISIAIVFLRENLLGFLSSCSNQYDFLALSHSCLYLAGL